MVSEFALIIFLITYAGVAIGEIPGLALDRTGIALIGAILMVVFGVLSTKEAILSIDISTILLLYGLMVLSSQFRLGGFYTWTALKITKFMDKPERFLLVLMIVSAVLSAILANDIVCLAFTPVLTVSLMNAGLNPIPFLIGLAVSSNIGSASTIIGNPQNMLIGQLGKLDFGHFFLWCTPPSLLSLIGAYFVINIIYSKNFVGNNSPAIIERRAWASFNRHQSTKGIIATIILIILFFTDIPREISAISIAGLLLCSRSMHTRSILGFIDWHLITLFCALFIVIKGVEAVNLPFTIVEFLNANSIDIHNLYILTGFSTLLSNIVSNVPATMLITKFLDPSNHTQWYVLALSSTFAGNLITIGSIANLITFEQAKEYGVNIGFKEHAKVGIPVTVVSIFITIGWIIIQQYIF
ncbi:MAG: anion transporter [Nitrospinae bacterium RIFCSPLOWO2_12_39_16]|nr:MAG: anion transporter [Nitrospinae bacterium RIFCSPLOWO2_02_39_17]OGW12122.1 MAG: anion transporter [Nitrospinae bacterium RIFCSPLOWO2_12_39_16]